MFIIITMTASYVDDDDDHHGDCIIHGWWWSWSWWQHHTRMMIMMIMMTASYTDDDNHEHDDCIIRGWWWSSVRVHRTLTIYNAANFVTDGRTNKAILEVNIDSQYILDMEHMQNSNGIHIAKVNIWLQPFLLKDPPSPPFFQQFILASITVQWGI